MTDKENNQNLSGEPESPKVDDYDPSVESDLNDSDPKLETATIELHFVSGYRGREGKSFFVKTIAHYCAGRHKLITLVDCDRINPDVSNVYKEAERVFFSENQDTEDDPDAILNWATERKKPVLINLPGQVHEIVTAWIDRTLIPVIVENAELGENDHREVEVKIYNWFLFNGERDSLNLFVKSLKHFGGCVQHILVRNHGMTSDWSVVDTHEDFKLFSGLYTDNSKGEVVQDEKGLEIRDNQALPIKRVIQINLPRLSKKERDRLNTEEVTFAQALLPPVDKVGNTQEGKKAWPLWSRQRIQDFLKKAEAELENTGLI